MKKTVSSILLASALLLGAIAPVTANAATTGDGFSGKTNSSVTFQKPESTTTPVDPNNPNQPGNGGDDHGGTNPSGDLTFLYVSPKMDFGTAKTIATVDSNNKAATVDKDGTVTAQTLNPKTIESTVLADQTTAPKLVTEVSDTRGTNAGWIVSVTSSALKSEAGDALNGATITLNADDTSKTTIKNTADSVAKGANAVLNTSTQNSVDIYTAADGVGAGTTAMQLDASGITLGSLPANIKASDTGTAYTGELDWTLSATPQA